MISIVTTCMGRLEHFKDVAGTHLDQIDCERIFVDYSCPDRSGDWVEASFPNRYKIVRVSGRRLFNLPAARNIGARSARGDYIAFVDADTRLQRDALCAIRTQLNGNTFAHGDVLPELFGFCIVPRAWYARVGGYDDAFRYYSYDDVDFYDRLEHVGLAVRRIGPPLISTLTHSAELRLKNYGECPDLDLGSRINCCYGQVKLEVIRQQQNFTLTMAQRQAIYSQVEAAVRNSESDVAIQLPTRAVKNMPQLTMERVLRIKLVPKK